MMKNRAETILKGIQRTKRVANAYLFLGGDAKNKLEAALTFARALNCEAEDKLCGACLNCRKALAGVHPDIIIVEKDKASFKIDQVRNLKELVRYGPAEGSHKIIIINDADTMTNDAANSFLKSLEEPPPYVTFILIGNREEGMLPTIISRCQKILFRESEILPPPDEIRSAFNALKDRPNDFIGNSNLLSEFENTEALLSQLFTLFALGQMAPPARSVFSALKNVKRSGNKKLALDWLCYKLWKTN